jgi:hypothetical protein
MEPVWEVTPSRCQAVHGGLCVRCELDAGHFGPHQKKWLQWTETVVPSLPEQKEWQ